MAIQTWPSQEEIDAAIERDEPAVMAGTAVLENALRRFAVLYPKFYVHPKVDPIDGYQRWCIHLDNSGYGCIEASIGQAILHVDERHPNGGNCGH
jgi:hypothetical protein